MRLFRVVVLIAFAACACQRRKTEPEQGLGSATGWSASVDAARPADASPCVEDCVKRSQMRATAPEHIVGECMAECGITPAAGLAEMPDLTLRVPAEALQEMPRCARVAAILTQIVQCPQLDVALRHHLKGMVEQLIEAFRVQGESGDAEGRRQLEQQCRFMAIQLVESMRPTGCKVELGGPP